MHDVECEDESQRGNHEADESEQAGGQFGCHRRTVLTMNTPTARASTIARTSVAANVTDAVSPMRSSLSATSCNVAP